MAKGKSTKVKEGRDKDKDERQRAITESLQQVFGYQ